MDFHLIKQNYTMKKISAWIVVVALLVACNPTKSNTEEVKEQPDATEMTQPQNTPQSAPAPDSKPQNAEAPRPKNASSMFERIDADGDGQITEAEARGPVKKNFAQMDTDGNGTISLEELEAAMARRQ